MGVVQTDTLARPRRVEIREIEIGRIPGEHVNDGVSQRTPFVAEPVHGSASIPLPSQSSESRTPGSAKKYPPPYGRT